jgi:hypothetical protein
MTIWIASAEVPLAASWVTASSRWLTRPMLPVVGLPLPVIALVRSNQTAVGWLAIRLPPVSARALARQIGFT